MLLDKNDIEGRFTELINMPIGWDGYTGIPVEPYIIDVARNILANIPYYPDAIVPGGDGTMAIEWHSCGIDVEINILGSNHVEIFSSFFSEIIEIIDNDYSFIWILFDEY